MADDKHQIVPRVEATGEVFSLDPDDLDGAENWHRYYQHCIFGVLVCDTCLNPIYLQERHGMRIACEYTPAEIAAHENESPEHQALKDMICTYAAHLGLEAKQEKRSSDGGRVTDVLVVGE